jgi:FixJ family two-component response regulator
MNTIDRVAVIDDDHAILDSFQLCLRKRGFEVLTFASAKDFLAELDAKAFDCIVSDVKMPGMTGLALQRALSLKNPSPPLILITGHGDIDMAVAAIKAGASEFIEKPIKEQRLTKSISDAISRYKRTMREQQESTLLRQRYCSLSERQQTVITLAAQGLSSKEIAVQLGISPRTVEHYRESAMGRMQAGSFAELVQMVVRLDLHH